MTYAISDTRQAHLFKAKATAMPTFHNHHPRGTKHLGFSLTELTVALAISTFLLLGLSGYFVAQRQTTRTATQLAQQQESLRLAYELLARDIRESRYLPCGQSSNVNANGALLNKILTQPLQIIYPNETLPPPFNQYDNPGASIRRAPNTTAIIVRYARSDSVVDANLINSNLIQIVDTHSTINFRANDIIVICNHWGVTQSQISNTSGSNISIQLNLNENYQRARIALLQERIWFIGTNSGNACTNNTCSLYSAIGGEAAQEFVTGVTNLELTPWCHDNNTLQPCSSTPNGSLAAIRIDNLTTNAQLADNQNIRLSSQPLVSLRNPI